MILIMKVLNFLSLEKILVRLKRKIIFTLICFIMKSYFVYPVYILDETLKNCMGLQLILVGNELHYVYIKYFNRFMFNKTKSKNKKHFSKYCYNVLVEKEF